MNKQRIEQAYQLAKEQYADLGVNTDAVLNKMNEVVISLHCWQTDDVGGFETPDATLSGGGIQATGNYPGKAHTIAQVRADLEKVLSLLPGKQRLNLHAIYGDFQGERVDRDQIEVKHFQSWIDWCKAQGIGMDFNASCFSHSRAADGYTLSSKNEENRKFWVEHVKRCRAISAEMGKQLGTPCVHNTWIPDGSKDTPVDRNGYRALLKKSLDEAMAVDYPKEQMKDAVESKLFGIGAESMTVGSHDFYLGYAIKNNKLICLDNGHFHPTEQVGDKISSCLQWVDEVLLHVTRPIRWDSDHVALYSDDVRDVCREITRLKAFPKIDIALDYFDASINRIAAWVIGARGLQKSLLEASLEPIGLIRDAENAGKNHLRLALMEEAKTLPFAAVWDKYCLAQGAPVGTDWLGKIEEFEKGTMAAR